MRQQVQGCLKGALVGRDLCPPNLWEPQGAPLQEVWDSLVICLLGCPVLPRCNRGIRRGVASSLLSPVSER